MLHLRVHRYDDLLSEIYRHNFDIIMTILFFIHIHFVLWRCIQVFLQGTVSRIFIRYELVDSIVVCGSTTISKKVIL